MNISSEPQPIPRWRARVWWLLLVLAVTIAVASVLIPAWLNQPFRPQTARGVELSYRLRSWAPTLTALAVIAAIALSLSLWRAGTGKLRKAALLTLLIPLFAATWFSRENHFEWMFNPLPNAKYARVHDATFMNDKEMVMAIAIGGEAVAYPIRQMAYHHVVNDVIGGQPITATY
jgi:hypothetical protein